MPTSEISSREMAVLRLLVDGHGAKAIGNKLGITDATVKIHKKSLIRKFKARNSVQVAVLAIRTGLVS